ncbi:MAG: hypothetical protein WD898_02645, partial [Candidatus Paceibacterota bacterium]
MAKKNSAKEQDAKPKLTPEEREKELIQQREAGKISAEKFLEGLAEPRPLRELALQWKLLCSLLKKKRVIRNTDLEPYFQKLGATGKLREHKLTATRGMLNKFVEWGALALINDGQTNHYFCNLPAFYEPDELHKLIPEKEQRRVLAHISDKPIEVDRLAYLVYGDEGRNISVLNTFLDFYKGYGLIRYNKKDDSYVLTERGQELGVDSQTIKTLEATALENELFVKEEKAGELPNIGDVAGILKKDIDGKKVPVIDLTEQLEGKDLSLLFVGEVLYGSQYTDQKLLDWILGSVGEVSLALTSGLVQGRFEVRNKQKDRGLAEDLRSIDKQFHLAGQFLEWCERIATSHTCVIQGDDDWRLADDYGTMMHLAEGKNPWKFGVDWSSFSGEMKRRLENKELRRKVRIQWEIVQAYMYRIGRSLLNKQEVFDKIGVFKSEYRLMMEIMVARRHNFDYPKEYAQVVNVDALYGNVGRRIVSPDPLRLKVAEDFEIRAVHNTGFSDITQYQKTHQHLDAIARHMGLSRRNMPRVIVDYHQEAFFAEYLQRTWLMNLPGMQNTGPAASYEMKEWHVNILEAKERRQSRVRKEPVSPSAIHMMFCKDGRVRFKIMNNSVMQALDAQRNEPERSEVAVVATDFQFGSITNWPEMVVLFLDYALYDRKATRMWMNGDMIQGNIYPQHNAESRPMRLTSLHAQKMFCFNLILPLILDAPNLTDLAAWLGNHEWHNFDTKRSGDMPLTFLETALKGVLMERKRVGTQSSLERAMNVSRIRWMNTHNPQGDIINWPFFADNICGFKAAIQHMWQPFGG